MTDLAITARCWQDLGALPEDEAVHIVQVFAERRGLDPNSGETMRGVGGPLRKLHADLAGGRSIRAVTWYDPGHQVCWLLAAGRHEGFYERVEGQARRGELLPILEDVANFEADAPVRLVERVVRSAREALLRALAHPGQEVPLTDTPPPRAFFRVEDDRLWVRVVFIENGKRTLSDRLVAAIHAAVFGARPLTFDVPEDGGVWDSIYVIGPIPSPEEWPPPLALPAAPIPRGAGEENRQ